MSSLIASMVRVARRLEREHVPRKVGNGPGGGEFFLFPASARQRRECRGRFRPADIFLHQVDQGDGHIDPHVVLEFQHQVFFLLLPLGHQLQAAEPGNSLREMDHEVPLPEIEKAVDRPGGRGGRLLAGDPPHLAPMKQFVVAENHQLRPHQPKAPHEPPLAEGKSACLSDPRRGEQLPNPLQLARIVARQQHSLPRKLWLVSGDNPVEFFHHLCQRCLEFFDRFCPQVAGGGIALLGDGRNHDPGMPVQPRHGTLDTEVPAGILQPLQVLPPFVVQVHQVQQGHPTPLRKPVRDMVLSQHRRRCRPRAPAGILREGNQCFVVVLVVFVVVSFFCGRRASHRQQ